MASEKRALSREEISWQECAMIVFEDSWLFDDDTYSDDDDRWPDEYPTVRRTTAPRITTSRAPLPKKAHVCRKEKKMGKNSTQQIKNNSLEKTNVLQPRLRRCWADTVDSDFESDNQTNNQTGETRNSPNMENMENFIQRKGGIAWQLS